jgi:hypothetical protein
MNVIRHDDVSADHPSIGFAPCLKQRLLNHRIRELFLSLSRADRDKNDRGLIEEDENPFRWMTSLW